MATFTKLFSLPSDLYVHGSPLVIAAGALQQNNETQKVFVQLKLRNMVSKAVKGAVVALQYRDAFGEAVTDTAEYSYLDLAAAEGAFFGEKKLIGLKNSGIRSFEVAVKKVIFDDDSIWEGDPAAKWEPLPALQPLTAVLDSELIPYYEREIGTKAVCAPMDIGDLWLCHCGTYNKKTKESCRCGAQRVAVFAALNEELLQERKAADELAKAEAERVRAEEEAARKEKLKKAKPFMLGILVVIIMAIAAVIVVKKVVMPNKAYKEAVALMDAGKYEAALTAFEAMDGYKDSSDKIDECNAAILDGRYNNAIALMNAGNIIEAYDAFAALGGYKDSTEKANSMYAKYKAEKLKDAKVGDYIFFGTYEQDNNTSNGKEIIEWLVLEVKDGKALVISKYGLDGKRYNNYYYNGGTWEKCMLRKWLNNDFINAAFTADEKAVIPTVTVSADKNPKYDTDPGNATQDKVFLLSLDEVNEYLKHVGARQCEATFYAIANGAVKIDSRHYTYWWLRTPGQNEYSAVAVEVGGGIYESGFGIDCDGAAVRPAMWIEIPAQ